VAKKVNGCRKHLLAASKSSVDVALYTLLLIMVIMLIIMKYCESAGILDMIVPAAGWPRC
jgi:spore maturation protein SpmA